MNRTFALVLLLSCVVGQCHIDAQEWEFAFRVSDPPEKVDLEQTASWHFKGQSKVAIFHPNDRLVIAGQLNGDIRLYDCETGKLVDVLRGHKHRIKSLDAWADMQELLLSLDDKGIVCVWDLRNRKLLRTIRPDKYYTYVACARLSPDGRRIALGHENHRAEVVPVGEPEEGGHYLDLNEIVKEDIGNSTVISAGWVAWSRDGRLLAVDSGGKLTIWDIAKKRPALTLQEMRPPNHFKDPVRAAYFSFSPDGNLFAYHTAYGFDNGYLRIVSVPDGEVQLQYKPQPRSRTFGYTDWSADSRQFAVPLTSFGIDAPDCVVFRKNDDGAWNETEMQVPQRDDVAEGERFISMHFSRDGRYVVGGRHSERGVSPISELSKANIVWNAKTGEVVDALPSLLGDWSEFSSDGKMILVSGVDPVVFKQKD